MESSFSADTGARAALCLYETSLKSLRNAIVELLAKRVNPKGVANERSLKVASGIFTRAMQEIASTIALETQDDPAVRQDAGYQFLAGGSIEAGHTRGEKLDKDMRAENILGSIHAALQEMTDDADGRYASIMMERLIAPPKLRSRDWRSERKRVFISAEREPAFLNYIGALNPT